MSDAASSTTMRYTPATIESKWLARWLEDGAFEAHATDDGREPFTIVIPPPNVTGSLHMGHALNGSVQDCLTRWKRMQGYNALWLPGTDHAGIATQNVVEKELREEGLTRFDLGRESFLERVWKWRDKSGATIIEQFKRLGCSLDYRRERFTMDDEYARAVQLTFVRLFEKGYIYRDNYLVNWCGRCHTAISDLEVQQLETTSEMFQVDYPLVDGTGEVTVATVRPETIVADVAIAVHPDDERYRDMVGRSVRVPLTQREVPVIADKYVDPEFGTGALKITPGHDINDFEIGVRHDLPQLSAINPDLTMAAVAGAHSGEPLEQARKAMITELEASGALRSRESYRNSVPHCARCATRIEPLISLQWFCRMDELAAPALRAVEAGEVRFIPEGAARIFEGWMTSLRPWCLSRQLWWGHQLPVWYCGGAHEHVHVSLDGPEGACSECGSEQWHRDEDVLDTWFSSALWSYATLGWPEPTDDLRYFHPTSVLVTARDIINLWVARMMMMSFEFLGERPFADVYVHSVIQAPDGRRMSKSLGTGIDPLELIEQYGADATRYGLLNMSSTQDVRFNEGKIREGRELANKLWNASRLLAMFGDADAIAAGQEGPGDLQRSEDHWIVGRAAAVSAELTQQLQRYEFALFTKTLYSFVWSELCDWYLEAAKPRLRGDDPAARATASRVLASALHVVLRLAHPVMPHLTEEIGEQLWPDRSRLTMHQSWPQPDDMPAEENRAAGFERIRALVSHVRSLRTAAGVAPGQRLPMACEPNAPEGQLYLQSRDVLELLCQVDIGEPDGERGVTLPAHGATVTLFGLDPATLRARLEEELAAAEDEVRRAQGKLANTRFVERAPSELVDQERAKAQQHEQRAAELRDFLAQLVR